MRHQESLFWIRANAFIAKCTLIGLLIAASYGVYQLSSESSRRQRATVSGKYSEFTAKLYVPGDVAEFGEFCDFGFSQETSYRQYSELQPGFWVYVRPNWYLFAKSIHNNRD